MRRLIGIALLFTMLTCSGCIGAAFAIIPNLTVTAAGAIVEQVQKDKQQQEVQK